MKRSKKFIIFIFLIFLFVLSMSPIFQIKMINVKGLHDISRDDILTLISVHEGDNIFLISERKIKKAVSSNDYIEDISIKKSFPSEVNIDVKERIVRGYVPFLGSYLYIDENGRVLDIQENYTKALPLVNGLLFDNFKLGEILEVDNKKSLEVMVKFSQLMVKYNLLEMAVYIDVSDPEEITAKVNNVNIKFGNQYDLDEKIRTMAEIIKTIPKEDKGTLDLSDLNKPIVFSYIT